MSHPISRTRRVIEITVSVLVLVGVLLWMGGVFHSKVEPGDASVRGEHSQDESGSRENAGPSTGPSVVAEERDVPIIVEAVGSVIPIEKAHVAAQIMGVVQRVEVRPGASVAKGALLATLVAPEIQSQELQASGAQASASAGAIQAARDAERMRLLYEAGAVSRSEMERAQTGAALSTAAETSARGVVGVARSYAAYRSVRAPFAGVVTSRHADAGDLVSPGRLLFEVEDTSTYRFEAAVIQENFATLRVGDSVEVLLEGVAEPLRATLSEIVPAFDPATHTITVRATLTADPRIRSGLFGRLRVPSGMRRAVVVPADAVERAGTLELVRIVGSSGRVETRYVRTARVSGGDAESGGRVEILAGVKAGERVLVSGSSTSLAPTR